MDRRKFLTVSAAAGVTPLAGAALAAEGSATAPREYLLVEQYQIETEEQKNRFDAYLRDAAIPALNRQGFQPVGVFYPDEGFATVYVLLHDKSLEKLLSVQDKLLDDAEYARKGADVLDAIRDNPGFKRLESTVLLAFKGMPGVERPESGPGRVFQLRIYESPGVRTNRKKISMFNDAGEIAIFRRVGLQPVFFGQAIAGGKMPNLTYMLSFKDRDAQKAAWDKFRTDPGWLALKAMPEFADKTILCNITNLLLKPAEYSQL